MRDTLLYYTILNCIVQYSTAVLLITILSSYYITLLFSLVHEIPVEGLRVNATPEPDCSFMLPYTMLWIVIAVPRSPEVLEDRKRQVRSGVEKWHQRCG